MIIAVRYAYHADQAGCWHPHQSLTVARERHFAQAAFGRVLGASYECHHY